MMAEETELYEKVEQKLDALGIEYQIVDHEPALTIEIADRVIEGIEGVRTKTMFLTDKKKTNFFLVIMDDDKRMDMKAFGNMIEVKGIQMASAEKLYEKMLLLPGVVSPFGLLNNTDHDIQLYIDSAIMTEKRMCFHPNTNRKTLFLDTTDLVRFIESLDYKVNIIQF